MKIDLTEAKNNFGKKITKTVVTKIDDECFDLNLCKPSNLCQLKLEYTYSNEGVKVFGEGEIPLVYNCVRCAKPFPYLMKFSFDELFVENNPEKEEAQIDDYCFNQDVLSLDKCLFDTIVLALPQDLLCKDDCKGLCPYCYANLNEVECDCEAQNSSNNPFEQLKKLL